MLDSGLDSKRISSIRTVLLAQTLGQTVARLSIFYVGTRASPKSLNEIGLRPRNRPQVAKASECACACMEKQMDSE
jgi:hypothetical protein